MLSYEKTNTEEIEAVNMNEINKRNAETAKEKGNKLFSQGNYKEAINQYTKAIEYDSTMYILYITIEQIIMQIVVCVI